MCDNEVRCGIGGVCEDRNTSSGFECLCTNRNWEKSTEFLFYLDETDSNDSIRCDANPLLLNILYVLAGASCIVAFGSTLVVLRYKNQRIRIRFRLLMLGAVFSAAACILRVRDTSRLYGQDLLFTLLYTLGLFFARMATDSSWLSFTEYVFHNYPFLETVQSNSKRFKVIKYVRAIMFVGSVSNAAIAVTLPFYVFQADVTLPLVYYDLSVNFILMALLQIFTATYIFNYLETDIRTMIADRKKSVQLDADIKIKLRRLLPKFAFYKIALGILGIFTFLFCVPLFITEYSFSWWKYFLPIGVLAVSLLNIFSVRKQIRYAINKSKKFARIVTQEELLI